MVYFRFMIPIGVIMIIVDSTIHFLCNINNVDTYHPVRSPLPGRDGYHTLDVMDSLFEA